MVGVTKNVITLLEVITVPVNLVITFLEEVHVMVRLKLVLFMFIFYCLSQISMSVILIMETVIRIVLTNPVHIIVLVMLDIHSAQTFAHVMVSTNQSLQ